MQPPSESKINSVTVPPFATDAATLYIAAARPLRIVVRNVGGTVIFLAHDANTLGQPPGLSGTFQLPPGASEVFVLQARQGIYAAAAGAGGTASIAVSEALPQYWMEA